MTGLSWKLTAGLLMALNIVFAFAYVGPATGFTLGGHGAKILFFHLPCAWLASLAFVVGGFQAAQYLAHIKGARTPGATERRSRRRVLLIASIAIFVGLAVVGMLRWRWASYLLVFNWLGVLGWTYWRPAPDADFRCAATQELGMLFAILTTVTGSIFSKNEWGLYWSWDPRQTTIVAVMLIFAAYLLLRGSVADPETRARLCTSYALIAAVPGIFLIWVLPRLMAASSLHPGQAVIGGQLSPNFRMVLYGLALPAFLMTYAWLHQLRLRLFVQETVSAHADSVVQ